MPLQTGRDLSPTTQRAKLAAVVTGLLGVLMAFAAPFMPVSQTTAQISWPQGGEIAPVSAPLVTYVPIDLSVTVPCAAIDGLGTAPDGTDGSVLFSTTPQDAPRSGDRGLFIRTTGATGDSPDSRTVEVVVRNMPLLSATFTQIRDQGCDAIRVTGNAGEITAEFVGMTGDDGEALAASTTERESDTYRTDQRPQVTGIFTDLTGDAAQYPELDAEITVDSRYSTSPTLLKWLVLAVGVLSTGVSLLALARLDATDGRRHRRIFPARWWRLKPRDYVVIGALGVWHMIGPNTSDDGYLLTMARVAQESDYTANYFRWFGAPEAPFGWYYQAFGLLSDVSVASPWVRLPALACGIGVWLIVSHEVLPRLGHAALTRPAVGWTAAFVFLASWFPFNNGLRPEPIICLGALLTWCSVERAIATGRMLPAAVACLIGAFSLAAGPTGLLAVAALIAGARPMILALIRRAKAIGGDRWSYVALLAPIAAAGTFIVFVVFSNLTLRTFSEASSMKSALGPSLNWYNELNRYSSLFAFGADGSIARRFAVLVMLLGLVVSAAVLIRKSRIPGTALGPSRRIVGITFGSLVFLMFTPTKWTHHFGVFAGLAAALAAIAVLAAGQQAMLSRRNRTLFGALVLFITALAFTAPNSHYYASAWGMPWGSQQVSFFGQPVSGALLYASLGLGLVALWFHFREPFTGADPPHQPDPDHRRFERAHRAGSAVTAAPLAYIAFAVVAFQLITAAFTAVNQSDSYSTPRSNVEALTGQPCGMAEKVWVEEDPSEYLLPAVDDSIADPLAGPTELPAGSERRPSSGFSANGVPTNLDTQASERSLGVLSGSASAEPEILTANTGGTGGGVETDPGINGSYASLPFYLEPQQTPIMGSFSDGEQVPARLTSAWFALPTERDDRPLLTMSVAGLYENPNLLIEYSTDPVTDGVRDNELTVAGDTELIDPGPRPSWRNARVTMDSLPADITAVRIIAIDENLAADRFIVVTPPRLPALETMQEVVGSTDPVHVDWTSGLTVPCQRPFNHNAGIAEIPVWRIKPGADLAAAVSAWQNSLGGGPLGWLAVSQRPQTLATYLQGDIGRDWGSLERYAPYGNATTLAEITTGTQTRSGWWSPAPIRH